MVFGFQYPRDDRHAGGKCNHIDVVALTPRVTIVTRILETKHHAFLKQERRKLGSDYPIEIAWGWAGHKSFEFLDRTTAVQQFLN